MKTSASTRPISAAACTAALLLAGCQSYHPSPLPTAPDLSTSSDLIVPVSSFALPGLSSRPVPADGLDLISVLTLAVFNNSELKAARLQSGVASAQVFDAGLLPDPQLGMGGGSSALNYGYGLTLTEDIQAILLRGTAQAAARQHRKQVDLNILWQEYQVAEQARELFLQARGDAQIEDLLSASNRLLTTRYRQDRTALQQGDVTAITVSADLTLLADSESALRQHELEASATRHTLNQLLGLEPGVKLKLIGPSNLSPLTAEQLQQAIAALPRRRTDLLALQAGYQSQEETLRRAVLAQFPPLNAGVAKSRDPVEGVNSSRVNVNLTLPIFNRNRGQIAIQRATRELLKETYQAQLDTAASQASQTWDATQILEHQLAELKAQLPELESTAAAAQQSFQQGHLNAGLYVSLKSSLLTKQVEALRLSESLAHAQSALRAVLGLPFVTVP